MGITAIKGTQNCIAEVAAPNRGCFVELFLPLQKDKQIV